MPQMIKAIIVSPKIISSIVLIPFIRTHEVDVYVKILEESDSTLFQKYRVDSIYVFINTYKEQANINTSEIDTERNIIYIQSKDKKYNENFIQKFIYQTHDTSIQKAISIRRFKGCLNSITLN
jgi:uncharacterized membrane protein